MSVRLQPRSVLHDERVAAVLGIALGVAFGVCFATGVLSHLIQNPPSWFHWPSRPAGLYRVTQGLHIATGIAAIPLLFAKLWVVFPKLFERPAFTGVAHFLERVSLIPLIGGGLFQLTSGVANINQWYPWPFGFLLAHYWVAWISIGALIVHIGAKWSITRQALAKRSPPDATEHGDTDIATTGIATTGIATTERRTFLLTVFGMSGLLTLFTVGQTVGFLERLTLLAPRRPSVGPQGFPVNRTAAGVGVLEAARSPDFRLQVDGNVRRSLTFTLDELNALLQHGATLPIACVEGWSTSQRWQGVRVRDLLAMAGAPAGASVRVQSLQDHRSSMLNGSHAHDRDTLLALRVNDEVLHIDHGFPVRLIGPNRPGTMQTKWVTRLEVL
ncbi:MAG: molybdopterin-dependent oxidoreductase [Acidimicrobiia bacterium]